MCMLWIIPYFYNFVSLLRAPTKTKSKTIPKASGISSVLDFLFFLLRITISLPLLYYFTIDWRRMDPIVGNVEVEED